MWHGLNLRAEQQAYFARFKHPASLSPSPLVMKPQRGSALLCACSCRFLLQLFDSQHKSAQAMHAMLAESWLCYEITRQSGSVVSLPLICSNQGERESDVLLACPVSPNNISISLCPIVEQIHSIIAEAPDHLYTIYSVISTLF